MTRRYSLQERSGWTGAGDVALRKQFSASVKDAGEANELLFTISTAAVDRDRDTIAPDGWNLSNYRKNPVVLFGHDYGDLPVARSVRIWIEGGKLKSQARFTPADLYPFGHTVYQLYREGFMRATSVGFLPLKWSQAEDQDRPYGIDFERQELLEYSCVPVPSNPEALVGASAKGIDVSPLKDWAEAVLDRWGESPLDGVPLASLRQVERVRQFADPARRRSFAGFRIDVDPQLVRDVTSELLQERGLTSPSEAGGTPISDQERTQRAFEDRQRRRWAAYR